jgi:hypothetical protein
MCRISTANSRRSIRALVTRNNWAVSPWLDGRRDMSRGRIAGDLVDAGLEWLAEPRQAGSDRSARRQRAEPPIAMRWSPA